MLSEYEVCKKLLSFKYKQFEAKMKVNLLKGVRIFDFNNDPFVDLEKVDFDANYKYIKRFFIKKSNWLKVQKYKLEPKPTKYELQ